MEEERLGLRTAEPAVERDQLLERAALVEVRVVEAADHAGRRRARSRRSRRRCCGRVRRERARADPRPRRAPRRGGASRAGRAQAGRRSSERTSSQPTCGCARERRQEPRMARLDLLDASSAAARPSGRRARGSRRRARRRPRPETSFFACFFSFGGPSPRRTPCRPRGRARRRPRPALTSASSSERVTSSSSP